MKKKKKRKKKDGWETLKSSLSATGMMFNIDLVLVLRTCMYVWYVCMYGYMVPSHKRISQLLQRFGSSCAAEMASSFMPRLRSAMECSRTSPALPGLRKNRRSSLV